MDVVWQDVVNLQANLDSVSVGAQMVFLAYVNEDLNPAAFGGEDSARYRLARCYLAAHLGELERRNGGQSVNSETFGTNSVTVSYGTSEEALAQTSWGRLFHAMLLASPLRIGLTWC